MRIWIVNYYTSPTCSNPRYLEFAKHFMAAGHEVLTFYANYGGDQSAPLFQRKTINGLDFVEVRAPHFVGNGMKRMLSIRKFAQIIRNGYKQFERPDVILQNIHPPFDYPIVKLAKKLKCRYIAEAWDLWPESFVRFGLIKESNPLMKVAHAIEKRYYYSADEIVFTLKGAVDYLKQQRWTIEQGGKIDPAHVHYINNGIDLDQFEQNRKKYPRIDTDMKDMNLIKIIYLGSINKANNVKTLIEAASQMQDLSNYRFFIYGNGAYRSELEQFVKDNHIINVVFKEKHIPLEECAWVTSQATVNIMNYEKGFGKWGASSGKMFQYLAAGKPIICNVKFRYDNVINDNSLGVSKNITTPEEFAEAIRKLAEQPKEDYDAMCERVHEVAKRFDYKVLAAKELIVIEGLMV